jgi:uncharacterized protein YbjT (DUF2867 family)
MQVFTTGPLFAGIHATGTISIPAGTAKISYIDVRDIAAVAAAALTQPSHLSRAYTLTGGEALDHHQIADLISRAGCSVRYVPLSDAEARRNLETAGLGGQRADRLLGFYNLVRQGFCAPVSPDVGRVLGRPPISISAFAHDHAASWR